MHDPLCILVVPKQNWGAISPQNEHSSWTLAHPIIRWRFFRRQISWLPHHFSLNVYYNAHITLYMSVESINGTLYICGKRFVILYH